MSDLIYLDKELKQITKNVWEELIRDKEYCWLNKFYKDDLYLSSSWTGVAWSGEKHPKVYAVAINAIDEDGRIFSIVDFVCNRQEMDSEFLRVKGLIEDGIIYADKEPVKSKPTKRKRGRK